MSYRDVKSKDESFSEVVNAVLPTFMAEKWYPPIHSEDIVESEM